MTFDIGIYDRMERLIDLGAEFPVTAPRDILFNGDGSTQIGQISSFRRLDKEKNVMMNFVLVAENHENPTSMKFAAQTGSLLTALSAAAKQKIVDVRGPGMVFLAQLKGEPGVIIASEGSNSFGVLLFTVFSKPDADPREDLKKLGPVFQQTGILKPQEAKAYAAKLANEPLRPPVSGIEEAKLRAVFGS